MPGTHEHRPGEKTRQSDKKLEEHESVLDSPEHIRGVEKSPGRNPKQSSSQDQCDSVLSGPECIEPEEPKKPSGGKYG
jgi:hypothetical protein